MADISNIFTGLLKADGDGFKGTDRELLWRVAQGFSDHVTSDNERHKKHEERCDKISGRVNDAHNKINNLNLGMAWLSGMKGTIGFVGVAIIAIGGLAVAIWNAVKGH